MTPVDVPYARKLGYLRESIAIGARAHRCRLQWKEHLQRTQTFIRDSASHCDNRRQAVVVGSGWLLDIPIEFLSEQFGEVLLIDVVHPHPIRKKVKLLSNVQLVSADITGGVVEGLGAAVHSSLQDRGLRGVWDKKPDLSHADFVISANILSQLSVLPLRLFENFQSRNPQLKGAFVTHPLFAHELESQHLQWLKKCGGKVCLITDFEAAIYQTSGRLIEREKLLTDLDLTGHLAEWDWEISPLGEETSSTQIIHSVRAYRW
jgi:hypothetical protein